MPGVLAVDDVGTRQNRERPERNVGEVPDRRRYEIETRRQRRSQKIIERLFRAADKRSFRRSFLLLICNSWLSRHEHAFSPM
jgi:hypothetical protein